MCVIIIIQQSICSVGFMVQTIVLAKLGDKWVATCPRVCVKHWVFSWGPLTSVNVNRGKKHCVSHADWFASIRVWQTFCSWLFHPKFRSTVLWAPSTAFCQCGSVSICLFLHLVDHASAATKQNTLHFYDWSVIWKAHLYFTFCVYDGFICYWSYCQVLLVILLLLLSG